MLAKASNFSEMKFFFQRVPHSIMKNEGMLPEFRVCGFAAPASAPSPDQALTVSDSVSYSYSVRRSWYRSGAWIRGRSWNRSSIATTPKRWLLRYLNPRPFSEFRPLCQCRGWWCDPPGASKLSVEEIIEKNSGLLLTITRDWQ